MISFLGDADFAKIKYYLIGFSVLAVSISFIFVVYKPFRKIISDYLKNNTFFIVIFGLFYLVYIVTRVFFFDSLFGSLYNEDGFFENLTALFFLIAGVYFVRSFLKRKNTLSPYTKVFIIAMAAFCFFVGMEEISWGQRILGIETPEHIKEINHQGETTLHNIIHERFYYEIYGVFAILCLVFFAFTNTKYKALFGISRDYLPSKKFLIIAFLMPFILFFNMEHFEVILSFMFLVYAYQLSNKRVAEI